MSTTVHDIDPAPKSAYRPHVHLCHRILNDALTQGYSAVEISVTDEHRADARAQVKSEWKDFMAVPLPLYTMLVGYFKRMAGVDTAVLDTESTIPVRSAGREASVHLTTRRSSEGKDEVHLRFS